MLRRPGNARFTFAYATLTAMVQGGLAAVTPPAMLYPDPERSAGYSVYKKRPASSLPHTPA
jgi:hypothetical protein